MEGSFIRRRTVDIGRRCNKIKGFSFFLKKKLIKYMTDFVNTFFVVLTLIVRYTLSNCPLSHMPPSKRGVRIDLLNPLL